MLNDVAVTCSKDIEWAVQLFIAQHNIYRFEESNFLLNLNFIKKSIKISKSALINVTSMILLIFIFWGFLFIFAVLLSFFVLLLYQFICSNQWRFLIYIFFKKNQGSKNIQKKLKIED